MSDMQIFMSVISPICPTPAADLKQCPKVMFSSQYHLNLTPSVFETAPLFWNQCRLCMLHGHVLVSNTVIMLQTVRNTMQPDEEKRTCSNRKIPTTFPVMCLFVFGRSVC